MRAEPAGAPDSSERRHPLAALVLLLAGMWLAPLTVLALFCLWTGVPVLLGLCLLGLGAGLCAPLAAWTRRPRRRRRALLGFAVCLGVAGAVLAPWPRAADPSAAVRHESLGGEAPGAPWCSLVPEAELVRLGAWVMSTPREFAACIRPGLMDAVYAEEPVVASPASWVVDAWLVDRGRYRLALPAGEGPFPLLVFLHGSGGPFQFYPQVLARPFTERGVAVAFPSFGFGDWSRPAGYRRVEAVIEDACARFPLDDQRIVIGGLSAGALGALEAFARQPGAFRGCVAISGVPPGLDAAPFVRRPLLVIHSTEDERLPVGFAQDFVKRVRKAGGSPDYVELAGTHYVLLTHREEVVRKAADWVADVVSVEH